MAKHMLETQRRQPEYDAAISQNAITTVADGTILQLGLKRLPQLSNIKRFEVRRWLYSVSSSNCHVHSDNTRGLFTVCLFPVA